MLTILMLSLRLYTNHKLETVQCNVAVIPIFLNYFQRPDVKNVSWDSSDKQLLIFLVTNKASDSFNKLSTAHFTIPELKPVKHKCQEENYLTQGLFQGHIMTGSHAMLLSQLHSTWRIKDYLHGCVCVWNFSEHRPQSTFLKRRCSAVMEKYVSFQKKSTPVIPVALLYLDNLNKSEGYLYLINWKNLDYFSIQTIPLLVGTQRSSVWYSCLFKWWWKKASLLVAL